MGANLFEISPICLILMSSIYIYKISNCSLSLVLKLDKASSQNLFGSKLQLEAWQYKTNFIFANSLTCILIQFIDFWLKMSYFLLFTLLSSSSSPLFIFTILAARLPIENS